MGLATAAAVAGGVAVNDWPPQPTDQLYSFWGEHQAGILTPPNQAVLLVALEVLVTDRPALTRLCQNLTTQIQTLMAGLAPDTVTQTPNFPPSDTGELGFDPLKDGHLLITLGVGAALFVTTNGQDRFGLAAHKPIALKPMPVDLPGDQLNSALLGGDLFLQISSDHPLLNLHAVRAILRATKGQLNPLWLQPGFQRFVEAAPHEANARGLFGFKDGTANPDPNDPQLMAKLVWSGSEEPTWAQGGTYLAVRLIREQLEQWDKLALAQQETVIGRHKTSGVVIGQTQESQSFNYSSDLDGQKVALNSHIRKANPRLGVESEQRRMLRRGYLYFNGLDRAGLLDAGMLFMAFCRNLEAQFEYVKRQYMSNSNFPKPETGQQSLDEFMACIGGGYFFVLPGVPSPDRFLADALLLG